MLPFDEEKYRRTLLETFDANKDMKFLYLSLIRCITSKFSGKYVGCVHCQNDLGEEVCVNINNSASKTMLYYPKHRDAEFIGDIPEMYFSYTGGCFWGATKGHVYGFPRNSSKLLDVDINGKTVKEVDCGLDMVKSNKTVYGHHYGGVLKGDTIVIPPRLAENVLLIDIARRSCRHGVSQIFRENNYNGAVLHPNGRIYFTPMHGSAVAEFDLETLSVRLMGRKISNSIFGGVVYTDGCIYSFSQNKGLYRIDPKHGSVDMILETAGRTPIYGSYSTCLHYNGKIYNVPGNSKYVYEYDPVKQVCEVVSTFNDGRFNDAKWAGAALLENGNVYMTPAFGRFVCEMQFDRKPAISDDMRELIYSQYMKPL